MQETQEITLVKAQASKALTAASGLVITDQEGMEKATDVLSKIKSVGKMIKDRKEEITKPLNAALASARDLFKPIEQNHAEAERIIKSKMLTYQNEQERLRQQEIDRATARVERGTMKPETAVDKIANLPEVQKTVRGNAGAIQTRTIRKVRITDESLVPREYLTLNMALINTAALRENKTIPGVEVYEEKTIASTR